MVRWHCVARRLQPRQPQRRQQRRLLGAPLAHCRWGRSRALCTSGRCRPVRRRYDRNAASLADARRRNRHCASRTLAGAERVLLTLTRAATRASW